MKKVTFLLLMLLGSYAVSSQNYDFAILVQSSDTSVAPNGETFESNNAALNSVLDNYTVTYYGSLFSDATTTDAQNSYELVISDTSRYDELYNDLDSLNLFQDMVIAGEEQTASCTPLSYNDPLSSASYYIDAMNIDCAWNITEGDPNITVAIVDVFFDNGHPDLYNKIVDIKRNCKPTLSICGHGFASAGAVGAIVNNNNCVAGAGSKTTIAGYCTGSSCNTGSPSGGSRQAYGDGYKIIHISYVGNGLLRSTVEEWVANGVVVTLPSYGSGHSNIADIDGVINVGQVNSNLDYVPYSGFEENVDIYAACINVPRLQAQGACSVGSGNTSFGGPTVAGIVALMRDVNPCLSPADIENIIKDTHLGLPNNAASYPAIENGIIDAYAAVDMAQNYTGTDKIITGVETIESQVISGDLIVKSGAELTVTGKLKFSSNSRVLIERGARLIMDGAEFTLNESCGSGKWEGIVVEGNSVDVANDPDDSGKSFIAQPVDPYTQLQSEQTGVLIMINNSKVDNAVVGVRMRNIERPWPESNDYYGGLIYADNSSFENCNKAAEFMRYGYNDRLDHSEFIGCTFSKNTTGVTNWASNGVRFDNCTFDVSEREGIVAWDASISVSNGCTFNGSISSGARAVSLLNTHPNINASEIGDLANSPNIFNDCFYGVHVTANTNAGDLEIRNNDFNNSYYGVFIEGSSRYEIRNNSFNSNKIGQLLIDNGGDFYSVSRDNLLEECEVGIFSVNYNEGFKFLDNCFVATWTNSNIKQDFVWGANQYQHAQINKFQRNSVYYSGGSSFSEGPTTPPYPGIHFRTQRGVTYEKFKYFVKTDCNPNICERYPTNTNSGRYDVLQFSHYDNSLDCGINSFQATDDNENCRMPDAPTITNLQDSISAVELDISDTEDQLNDTSISPTSNDTLELQYLLEEYANCLNKLKGMLIEEYIIANDYNGLLIYFSDESDFGIKTLIYGALVDANKVSLAKQYIQGWSYQDQAQSDFISVQLINLRWLIEGDTFSIDTAELTYIESVGENPEPLSGYARAVYHLLTDSYIEVEIPSPDTTESSLLRESDKPTLLESNIESIVSPNPFNNFIKVNLENRKDASSIEIINLNGKKVYSKSELDLNSDLTIRTSDWLPNLYILVIYNADGSVIFHDKLIKQ